MSLRRTLPVLLLCCVLACVSRNVDSAPPTKDQIAKLIGQLGDNDFDTREAASQKLWAAGEAAEEALQAAAAGTDAEVSRRARDILDKFKWGIYPETPKVVVDAVARYQTEKESNLKLKAITVLLEAGPSGCKAVVKIAKNETSADIRPGLMNRIAEDLPRALPQLMGAEHAALLNQLIEIGLEHQINQGFANHAAYSLIGSKLDERIAHFEAAEKKSDSPAREAEILVHLYHARGDLGKALAAAKRADLEELTDNLLVEMGDWKQLAARKPLFEGSDDSERIEILGIRAAYYRLAGMKKEEDEAFAEMKKKLEGAAPGEYKHFLAAKALLLNGRTADALQILTSTENTTTAFDLLCARFQYEDAFNLVDRARLDASKDAPALEIAQARTLGLLGEKEKAAAIFARYAAMIKEGGDLSWYVDLIEAEVRAGFTETAFEHALKILSVAKDAGLTATLIGKLFPGKKDTAGLWWQFLRDRSKNELLDATMKQLRELLDGKTPPKQVAELLDAWEFTNADVIKSILEAGNPERVERLEYIANIELAAADVAVAAKLEARALALLDKAHSSAALQKLGDLLADKKQWVTAAKAYRRSWEADRRRPLPLWLNGWALQNAGKDDEGKKLMETAHWMPLGAESVRHDFALDLLKRNQVEDARRENDLILKVGEPGSFHTGEAARRAALSALMRRDFAAAADGQEKALLRVLRRSVSFIQVSGYVVVPAAIHRQRAASLLKDGKTKEALAEARLCLDISPGHIDLPIALMPELEKRGMKKEADALFDETLKVHEKLCRDFPNSSVAHNSVAWLRACCRRDLDQALEHALKATKLAPNHAGHHDTLAEVYFQRGDKDKALAIQKKVVQMEPKRAYFRKQLKRIEAGDPKAERPMEDDDEDDDD